MSVAVNCRDVGCARSGARISCVQYLRAGQSTISPGQKQSSEDTISLFVTVFVINVEQISQPELQKEGRDLAGAGTGESESRVGGWTVICD